MNSKQILRERGIIILKIKKKIIKQNILTKIRTLNK